MRPEVIVDVVRISASARLPSRQDEEDAGWDLYADRGFWLWPFRRVKVPCGIVAAVPPGFAAFVWDRSGMGARGVHRLAGVIDAGYRDEWKVVLVNLSFRFHRIRVGDRIAQFVVDELPRTRLVERASPAELPPSRRGRAGFQSSGR